MRIRTKLEIGTLIVFVAALIIGLVLFFTSSRVNRATEEGKITLDIVQKASELGTLTFNHFNNLNERTELEWHSKNTMLAKMLASEFTGEQSQVIIRNLRQNQKELEPLFLKLNKIIKEENTTNHTSLSVNDPSQILVNNNLQLKLQNILNEAFKLTALSQSDISATERTASAFIFISIAVLGLFVTIGSFLVRKSIVEPIAQLDDGTKKVGQGNLHFQINISAEDEIGELAKAFNTMTLKLNGFYENLEDKVRQRSEEILEKNILFQSLVDNIPIGVALMKAPKGEILIMNQAGVKLLGRSLDLEDITKDQYTQKYTFQKEDGTSYPNQELPPSITLEQGEIVTKDDIVVCKPDESKISLRTTSAPVKNAQGRLASVVTIFEDITARKEIEKMKNQFLSFAAHQLRTPLGSIHWNLEMLLKGEMGKLLAPVEERLDQINQCNQRMIGFVNELLEVSLIQQGKWVDQALLTDIVPIIQDAVKGVELDTKSQNISITIIPTRFTIPKIIVDPKRFREVILNLLSNAIKYNRLNGKVTIEFKLLDKKLQIMVTDTGMGIPLNDQSKIFSEFFRAKNAILAETEGTGVGLFMIKSYIERWGGKIFLESEEGKYTTYYLEFQLP